MITGFFLHSSLLFWTLYEEKFEKPLFLETEVSAMASILEVIMSISLPPDSTLKPGYTLKIICQSMKRCWVSSAQILFHSSGVTSGPGCSRKPPHWFSHEARAKSQSPQMEDHAARILDPLDLLTSSSVSSLQVSGTSSISFPSCHHPHSSQNHLLSDLSVDEDTRSSFLHPRPQSFPGKYPR